ncbi:hypothetical protein MAL08_00360 [Leptospira noguchii]|nr:hypothetical protein [Leptospira noguchii]UOG37876.1 hypothetical protein MAL08_00360 [Leptospira noguchii]
MKFNLAPMVALTQRLASTVARQVFGQVLSFYITEFLPKKINRRNLQ